MVRIVDPQLAIEHIEDRPGDRRVVVTYGIEADPGDPAVGVTLHEEVLVGATDEHDAPIPPNELAVRMEDDVMLLRDGVTNRILRSDVHRTELDVEQDWWGISDVGTFIPIAEFPDHLVATIRLTVADEQLDVVRTPTVTGSWGALGVD